MAQTKIEQGLLKFTEATDYLKIPTGTTAQRPSSAEAGYIRFNTTISKFETYNGTEWTEPGVQPPTITSLDYPATKTALDPAGGETLLINGTNFQSGVTVQIDGSSVGSVTINSEAQLSIVTPVKTANTYTLTVTNTDGGSVQTNVIYNALPTWTTAAGSLGSVEAGSAASFTVAASEPDAGSITYTVTVGSLPSGLSLNSSTGAITGTAPSVSADTTSTFTITATDDENQTATREFSITVTAVLPSQSFGTILYEGDGSTSHSINGGKFGAGAYFDGSTTGITTPLRTNNWVSDYNDRNVDFTYSCWFKNKINDSNDRRLISLGMAGSPYQYVGIKQYQTELRFEWYTGTTGGNVNTTMPVDDNWHHLVCVRESSYLKMYLDGTYIGQTQQTANTTISTSIPLVIGANDSSLGSKFKGLLDQVRIFTKALSSSEVSTLYAETASTVTSLDPLSEDTTDTLQVLGDSSCIATYRFENDETDLSGNYDGTGTAIQYAAGRYGQAASFNGSGSRVDVSSISSFPSGNASRTISFWMYSDSYANGGIVAYGTAASNQAFAFYIGSSQLIMTFYGVNANINYALSTGQWYHVVATHDGTTFKAYINGSEEYSDTRTLNTGTAGFRIGGVPWNNSSEFFNGKIDQVRIFNKALSAAEVTTLYNENSLVASYRFEGNANDDTRNYDGTATNVTYEYGLNFTPDFVWIKNRTTAASHIIHDSTRGAGISKNIYPDFTGYEGEYGNYGFVSSFDTGGFTVDASTNAYHTNRNGDDYVAWCLKANGGTTSSNTNGTITSTVQVNNAAGFSTVKYTGTGSLATVGHGLSVTPDLFIIKNLDDGTRAWLVYDKFNTATNNMTLNTTAASAASSAAYNNTEPTSTVFTVNTSTHVNAANDNHIAYCFHSVDGFSKIGSYTGTGTTQSIETGFEVEFLLIKGTSFITDWMLYDKKRSGKNYLIANSSAAEGGPTANPLVTFLSNGFQVHTSNSENKSGETFIYMAFAADPDVVVPTKAKSFSTVTYTGTGATQSIEGLGFSPNLVFLKMRNNPSTYISRVIDSVRGATKEIYAESTLAENTEAAGVLSLDTDGFTLGTNAAYNNNGTNFVAWAWKADDNEPTINTEGSIDSIVSANPNAGFSIVKYISNGTSSATVGHGLSQKPDIVINKNIDNSANWLVMTDIIDGSGDYLLLNSTAAKGDGYTAPTSTTIGSIDYTSGSGVISYCFHSVAGYSKIGTYSGNNTGQTITTGFQPDFLMLKKTNIASEWWIIDSVRGTSNNLEANTSDAENTGTPNAPIFVSTGFNFPGSTFNDAGTDWIYMAFKIN